MRSLAARPACDGSGATARRIWTRPGLEYLAAMCFADAARSGQTLGVLVLHLHSLHAVNQRVGHTAGDATLRAVTDAVRLSTRTEDVVGRYGGDRMAILGVLQQPEDAVLIADRILERLAEQVIDLGDGQQIPIQVVAGIATSDAVEASPMQPMARGASAQVELSVSPAGSALPGSPAARQAARTAGS